VQGSQNPARPKLSLVLCTDGLVEVFDSRDDTLGVEGFARLILDSAKLPLPEMRQAVPRHPRSSLVPWELCLCANVSISYAASRQQTHAYWLTDIDVKRRYFP
jgi:hypothetical protein